jgi:hypothetical protein
MKIVRIRPHWFSSGSLKALDMPKTLLLEIIIRLLLLLLLLLIIVGYYWREEEKTIFISNPCCGLKSASCVNRVFLVIYKHFKAAKNCVLERHEKLYNILG